MYRLALLFLVWGAIVSFFAVRGGMLAGCSAVQKITTIHDYMKFTEQWEGKRARVYLCPAGFKTIGVGHRVKAGESFAGLKLTESQIQQIFREDMVSAYVAAKCSVKDFDKLPEEVKLILADLGFNLGKAGLQKFKRAIAACDAGDWPRMAQELRNSKWFRQVGKRSKNHVAMLEKLAV